MKCRFILPVLAAFVCFPMYSQDNSRWCVSTNAADLAYLLTLNVGAQYAFDRHFTVETRARWNPWSFKNAGKDDFHSRQRSFSLGARWWPWYTYSGWWVGAKGQYQEYNSGGLSSSASEEGDAVGMVLSAGYSFQITKWLDIDLGLGIWGGRATYTSYECPHCGHATGSGSRAFFLPDEMLVSAMFIF